MESLVAAVTYTSEGHKKRRNQRWKDGTFKYSPASRNAVLTSEEGRVIYEGIVPEGAVDGDDEFALDNHVSVLIDEWNNGQAPPPPASAPHAQAGIENKLPEITKGYSRPRSVPLPPAAAPLPASKSLPLPLPRPANNQAAPPRPLGSSQLAAPPVVNLPRQERSADEILGLLGIARSVVPAAKQQPSHPAKPAGLPLTATVPPPAKKYITLGGPANKWANYSAGGAPLAAPPAPSTKDAPQEPRPQLQQLPHLPHQAKPPAPRHMPASAPAPVPQAPPLAPWSHPSLDQRQAPTHQPPARAPSALSRPGDPTARPLAVLSGPLAIAAPPPQVPGEFYFPRPQEPLRRAVLIPERFSSISSYQKTFESALGEEIVLRLAEGAKEFHTACAAQGAQAAVASCNGAALETALRRARVPYFGDCTLFIWKNYLTGKVGNGGGGWPGKKGQKRKKGDDDGADDGDKDTPSKPENIYLILKSGRMKAGEYHKGDIWVISNHPLLRSGFEAGKAGDRSRAPFCAVVRAIWHGPNQDGKFEVEFLSPRPPNLSKSQPVYALKGPEASMELNLLDLLRSGTLSTLPASFLPTLLGGGGGNGCGSGALRAPEVPLAEAAPLPAQLAQEVITKFSLNEEQAAVVRHVAQWGDPTSLSSATPAKPPVCLVHGPFGTGKSSLLIAILHLVISFREVAPQSPLGSARVLVSAHTNVAVDRVLLGLAESGVTDFLRVGPLRRIDRRLLGNSLHATESRANATAVAELKDMLREAAGNPAEASVIHAELSAAERGAERQRRKLLKTAAVVGVTCCSSLLPVFEGLTFDLVVLDEASQMIEPLSLAPMLRGKCKFLVAVGDPLQLPPVLASPPAPANGAGLIRPLFVRMTSLELGPYLLRKQYRCHPAISDIPNKHFYGGRLLDGCSPDQRLSLLPGLPPVVFLDVRGTEQRNGRSVSNAEEARAAAGVIQRALEAGVPAARCGVICFYRAQVTAVKAQLQHCTTAMASVPQQKLRSAASTDPNAAPEEQAEEEKEEQEEEIAALDNDPSSVQVATVDAFQGAEKDLIVLTTAFTRSGAFASDACRLNVALTRARHNLVVVGCAPALERTAPAFAALLKVAKAAPGGFTSGGQLPKLALQQAQAQGPTLGAS